MAEFGVESFYGGGGSNFEPDPNGPFVGYQLNPMQIGFSTNPTTGDQLGEFQRGVRSGAKVIETNLLRIGIQGGGDSDQVVPTQHFKEIRALAKITGVSPSIHGPLVDAAGFGQQGNWSEEERDQNERIMFASMEKAKLADPDKNIPVIFHSSNMLGSGTHYKPEKDEKGKTIFKEEATSMFSRAEKRLVPISEKNKIRLWGDDDPNSDRPFKEVYTHDDIIENQNETSWTNEIKGLTLEKKYADELLLGAVGTGVGLDLSQGKKLDPDGFESENDMIAQVNNYHGQVEKANTLLSNNQSAFASMFEQAYEYGNDDQKRALKKMSDDYRNIQGAELKAVKDRGGDEGQKLLVRSKLQDEFLRKMKHITGGAKIDSKGEIVQGPKGHIMADENNRAPETFVRAEEFAMEEAAKTFGNVGAKSYKELGGDSAPVVSIENVWNGAMFSRGKDMKKLVLKSREEMAKNLMKGGMEEGVAKDIAKKKIGMNFDLGHMNMFRKKGFTTEDMVKEVEEFAPLINHMHVTDNFGMSDEHLYPGQGNVPLKEFLSKVSELHPDIDSFKKIVETGGVEARHMGGRSAHAFNLAAFGVPIFGGSYASAGDSGPTFDRGLDTVGSYFGGYGDQNPGIHHSMYGAGFTTLPGSFGGVMPGGDTGRSRFGGAPMS